jgi:hypothetical protein
MRVSKKLNNLLSSYQNQIKTIKIYQNGERNVS